MDNWETLLDDLMEITYAPPKEEVKVTRKQENREVFVSKPVTSKYFPPATIASLDSYKYVPRDDRTTAKGIGRRCYGGFVPPVSGPPRETFIMPEFEEERDESDVNKMIKLSQERMKALKLEKRDTRIKKAKLNN